MENNNKKTSGEITVEMSKLARGLDSRADLMSTLNTVLEIWCAEHDEDAGAALEMLDEMKAAAIAIRVLLGGLSVSRGE